MEQADFMGLLEHLPEHPEWQPGSALVYDLRAASSVVVDLDDLRAQQAFVAAHPATFTPLGATVVVSKNPMVRLLGALVHTWNAPQGSALHVVRTVEEAERALGVPAGTLVPLRGAGAADGGRGHG